LNAPLPASLHPLCPPEHSRRAARWWMDGELQPCNTNMRQVLHPQICHTLSSHLVAQVDAAKSANTCLLGPRKGGHELVVLPPGSPAPMNATPEFNPPSFTFPPPSSFNTQKKKHSFDDSQPTAGNHSSANKDQQSHSQMPLGNGRASLSVSVSVPAFPAAPCPGPA